jgi:predicted Rossmann fold nucleotide-binding protein DprA/Smf involved in DNA uptake
VNDSIGYETDEAYGKRILHEQRLLIAFSHVVFSLEDAAGALGLAADAAYQLLCGMEEQGLIAAHKGGTGWTCRA